jgi:polygalacturonase
MFNIINVMKLKYRFFLSVTLLFMSSVVLANDCNIADFGAGVKRANNAAAIQQAIDKCTATGGGTVFVPAGTYLSGAIALKNNVTLHLNKGAVLKGVAASEAYLAKPDSIYGTTLAFVHIVNAVNASLTGEGIIDGSGDAKVFDVGDNRGGRPFLVYIRGSRNIKVRDLHLNNSPTWNLALFENDGVHIDGLTLRCLSNFNADGIDIDSRNVVISNCIIDSDDDAICFKSHSKDFLCENVVVTNCILSTNCNAIKFGTASKGGFRNIAVSNIVIHKAAETNMRVWSQRVKGITQDTTVISGIALEMVDGGTMDMVTVSNVTMRDVQTPIFIRLGSRGGAGTLKNVIIQGITAYSASLMTSSVNGIPGHRVENVTLSDITLVYPGGGTDEDAERSVPEIEKIYPENREFGHSLPAFGLYVRHADNITIRNFQCYTQTPDARPAFVFDDVNNVLLRDFQSSLPSGKQPLIKIRRSSKIRIEDYRGEQPQGEFITTEPQE